MVRPDLHLPPSFVAWLAPFLAAFSRRTRSTTAALATGALLAVGPRTVTNCLRALGWATISAAIRLAAPFTAKAALRLVSARVCTAAR